METHQSEAQVLCIHSQANKIVKTNLGIITGSGTVILLDRIKDYVSKTEIINTDQILDEILKIRRSILNNGGIKAEYIHRMLHETGWMFTYTTLIGDQSTLRVAMYHPSLSDECLSLLEEHSGQLFLPGDLDRASIAGITKRYFETIKDIANENTREAIIARCVSFFLKAVSEVSEKSKSVSLNCDIAIVDVNQCVLMASNASYHEKSLNFESV